MLIVESDNIECSTLEEVVVGTWLVASCRDGTSNVVSSDDLTEMFCEERVDTKFTFLGQCGGVVSSIEDEVCLFKGEGVGFGRRPLLENFVANRPHEYTRMISVAKDKVSEVALVPFVEESSIVVACLASAPHVETLVHNDESHRVAHVEEFGGRWIVRASYGIATHVFEHLQLTVEGVFVDGRSKTTEVVVVAHAIDFHVLAVKPESCLRVELEGAETS